MLIVQLDNPGKCYNLDLDTNDLKMITSEEWRNVSSLLPLSTIITVTEDAPPTIQGDQAVRLVVLLYDDEAGIATGYFLDQQTPRHYFSSPPLPTLDLDDVTLKQTLHIGAQWARELGCHQILLLRPDGRLNPLRIFDAADILDELWAPATDVYQPEF